MKYLLFFLIFSSYSVATKAQTENDTAIASIAGALAEYNKYDISTTSGFSGRPSFSYVYCRKLNEITTTTQLEKLLQNDQPLIVRLYALKCLRQRNVKITDILMRELLANKDKITVVKGCFYYEESVCHIAADILIE